MRDGLQILAPRFDSGRGLQANSLRSKSEGANVALPRMRMNRMRNGLRPAQTPAHPALLIQDQLLGAPRLGG